MVKMNSLQSILFLIIFQCLNSVRQVTSQVSTVNQVFSDVHYSKCYDDDGKPQRCVPEFVNAAFNVEVEVTNTCGEYYDSEYCIQSGALGLKRACDRCDARDPSRRHPATYLTDFNNNENETWWQSETMYENIQWPNQVNLTLSLRKAFDITYVRLKFHSPRPESFAIYKRYSEDGPWVPYQYYSATCRDFYGQPDLSYVYGGEETRALCTSEFSDISPLTGGNVAFSTLEGRPSAYNFETSKELQEWVTATDIRVTLDRLNTFGDEVFGDEKVLRSYFYAITDFAVGGRCKCNGHASECILSTSETSAPRLVCRCEHFTGGTDCQECLPFYNDLPWSRATSSDAHECKPCSCNGFSNRCFFDQKLYQATGHGGHCIDCGGNRDGPNCERCKANFYERTDNYCIPCNCDETGSRSLQCNSEGKCQCKPGVTGDKCDRCQANYYDFGAQGCKACSCSIAGSFNNEPDCDVTSGICRCKENVEGQQCDKCKPGFFNLDVMNDFGCTPCFCFGHSAVCHSAPGYGQVLLESIFARSAERWDGEEGYSRGKSPVQYNTETQNIALSATGRDPVYFIAPDRFLGDQRGSYNQELNFTLKIGEHSPKPSAEDIILEGAGLRVSRPIFGGHRNVLPSVDAQEFSYRLHEHVDFGWNPRLTARDFMSILANLTSIKIRATYTPRGVGFLDNVKLKTARRGAAGAPAPWVESCTCPDGYIDQFCESCAPKFTHEPKNGGPFARCVPCTCNGHADICDPDSGQCICKPATNTAGDNCERCARGYYGNALAGTDEDCKPCPCPNKGACIQLQDNTIVCLECPTGYAGPQCEFCGDGYFGDPLGTVGEPTECEPCECNDNIDPNAVGNCNRTTGECLKCIYNSAGARCDQCLPGFYGDALALPKGDCKSCECNYLGTVPTPENSFVCSQPNGQCPCKDNVMGRQCDTCEDGFYDLASGQGCKECTCDPIGSVNASCNVRNGQCNCRQGVVGLRCTDCAPNHYGFSTEGCQPCACDHVGSLSLQCDPEGQCPCRENVEGRACERCKENKFNRQAGCVDCPACYNLVQEAVNEQREKLNQMEKLLDEISNTPTVINDVDFETKLAEVQERVEQLWTDAKAVTGGDGRSLLDQINELKDKVRALDQTENQIKATLQQCGAFAEESSTNLTVARDAVARAQEALRNAQRFLDSDGKDALERAEERSQEYGQQSNLMSEYAKQARQLAEEHENEAMTVEQIALKAVNTSTDAYDSAYNAYSTQRNASDESRQLQTAAQQLEEEVKSTEERAIQALQKAKDAYNNALTLYQNAHSQNLPQLDLENVRNQAKTAKMEAERLKAKLEELMEGKDQLLREAEEEANEAKTLVDNAQRHQQQADELLTDLDKAKASAEEARNQSENTFKDAQKIYDTLQDFHRNVDESKDRAEDAKTQIPEIIDTIREAQEITLENQQALDGAKQAASKALKDADDAKSIADKASEEADAIRAECGETKDKASQLRDETDALGIRVADISGRLKNAEDKVSEEDKQILAALEKASEAKTAAREAHEKVQQALERVRDISLALENLDQINDEGLNNLERKIEEVEDEVRGSGIEDKLASLRMARNKQALWIKNYEDELDALRKEVDNVQEIRNTLPPDNKCWKRIRLEP